jgi:hypothetical protein
LRGGESIQQEGAFGREGGAPRRIGRTKVDLCPIDFENIGLVIDEVEGVE